MKRICKKFISSLLIAVMILTAAPLSGFVGLKLNFDWLDFSTKSSAVEGELAPTGQCGENIYWIFDKNTGLLTISGSGQMDNNRNSEDSPFYNSTLIKTVVIENGVTSIGDYVFYGCTGLTSITIPDSVISIGDDAFNRCTGLTGITIPDSVTCIGSRAFHCCSGLTSIIIPDSVTSIGAIAFLGCFALETMAVSEKNKYYDSRENCNAIINTKSNDLIYGCNSSVIPNSIKRIREYAFLGYRIEKIAISNNVKSVGNYAFYGCTSLKSATIENGLTNIGDFAFSRCISLTSIIIPDSVIKIGNNIFQNCSGLTNIVISDNLTNISDNAFNGCTSLTNINIPGRVTSIGTSAFLGCTNLKSIKIPNRVTEIGSESFKNCTGLTDIIIGENVSNIGDSAFCNCKALNSITIPSCVTSIGWAAFFNCSNLKNVNINNGVKRIEPYAFCQCVNISSIKIPDSVTNIERGAFEGCKGLNQMSIGDNVTDIGYRAFYGCINLMSIFVSEKNIKYDSRDDSNAIIITESNKLIYGCKNTVIPNSVNIIADTAFRGCVNLESIEIPSSVTSVENGAFIGCDNLKCITVSEDNEVYDSRGDSNAIIIKESDKLICGCKKTIIPNSIKIIGNKAFYGCVGLVNLKIPKGVILIEDSAFSNCTNISKIEISDNTKSIGDCAFESCSKLKDVYYNGDEKQWESISIGRENSSLENANIHYNSSFANSFDNTVYKNVKVNFENKNSWGNYKIGVTALNFDPSWFNSDSSIYNHQMAQLASQFAMIGYTKKDGGKQPYLEKALKAIGFDDIELQPHAGRDEVNYFIASKKIKVGATVYNLVFTGFIGSNGKQWDSNFDPYAKESSTNYSDKKDLKGLVHLGFNDAKNYAYNKLKKYVEERGFDKDNTKILITGHSRGAATANLVAAKLIDEQNLAYSRNIFTFAFATPNSAKKQITDKPGNDYSRIFNIINPEDFVVKVLPTSWDFDKFGTTYTLPSITNDKKWYVHTAAMQMFFSEFTDGGICDKYVKGDSVPNAVVNRLTKYVNNLDEFYKKPIQISLVPGVAIKPFDYFKHTLCPFVNGSDDKTEALEFVSAFLGSDPMQLLLYSRVTGFFLANGNGVLSQNFADAHLAETYCAYMMAMNKQDIQWKRTSLLNTVNCPVDIEVYDKSTGELVGRIVNNVVDETVAAKENAIVMDVDGDSKMFYLPANGDYDVKLIGNDNGKMDYTVAMIDSDIGETSRVNFFDVDIIKGQSMTGEVIADEFILENYTLEKEEGEVLEPTEVQEDIEFFEVKTSTDGNGYVTDSMTVTSGDYVTVSATPKEGYAFKGWYNGDELVSSDNEYSFVAKNNITLTAKFAPIPKNVKSVLIDDISLNYKKSTTLKPTIKADDGAKYKVEYSTSNAKVATVDENGKVTATKRGSGTATITCTVTDSNGNVVKDTCKVNVSLTWWQWIITIVLFGWIWY